MSADLKVVSLTREGWREPVATLRLIADQMESGEIEACSIGAMVMIYESGGVGLFGFGPKDEDPGSVPDRRTIDDRHHPRR